MEICQIRLKKEILLQTVKKHIIHTTLTKYPESNSGKKEKNDNCPIYPDIINNYLNICKDFDAGNVTDALQLQRKMSLNNVRSLFLIGVSPKDV